MDPESSRMLSRKLPICASTLGADPVTTPAILRARGPSPDRELLTVYATLSLCDIPRKQLLSVFPGLRQEKQTTDSLPRFSCSFIPRHSEFTVTCRRLDYRNR